MSEQGQTRASEYEKELIEKLRALDDEWDDRAADKIESLLREIDIACARAEKAESTLNSLVEELESRAANARNGVHWPKSYEGAFREAIALIRERTRGDG